MKRILYLLSVVLTFFFISRIFAGVLIGSDINFHSSFIYETTNEVTPSGITGWSAKSTVLYLGLYPTLSEKNIKGRIKIYVNSSNAQNIVLGGGKIMAYNEDKSLLLKAFYLMPDLALSDPLGAGKNFLSDVYSDPADRVVTFSDLSHFSMYPLIYNELGKNTNQWIQNNYGLGGRRGVGLYTKEKLGNLFVLENFAGYSLDNFDSYGALLKIDKLPIFYNIKLTGGIVVDLLVYKYKIDFSTYNAFQFSDLTYCIPEQVTPIGSYAYHSVSPYIVLDILPKFSVFGQFKLNKISGDIKNPDGISNTLTMNGNVIYVGIVNEILPGTKSEVSWYHERGDQLSNNVDIASKIMSQESVKIFSQLDLENSGMKLYMLMQFVETSGQNGIFGFKRYNYLDFNGNVAYNIDDSVLRTSVKFDFLYMFSLRTLLYFDWARFSNGADIDYTEIANRTYFDMDLGDIMKGLWATIGFRFSSYSIDSSVLTTKGNASYFIPYAEIKYIIGDSSFLKLSWGMAETLSDIDSDYGLGYDGYKLQNSEFSLGSQSGNLYEKADYTLLHNYGIYMNVGLRL